MSTHTDSPTSSSQGAGQLCQNRSDVLIREAADVYHAKSREYLSSHQLADFRKCPLLYWKKKQGLVLEEACLELVGTFLQNAERNRLMIETLQERRLPRTTARREELVSRLIVRAAEERVMPWAMAQHVWKAYQEPSHSDFSEPTMWRVYNAFTEAVKTRKPVGQMETLSRLPKLLDVAALELPSETASESESFERVAGAGD